MNAIKKKMHTGQLYFAENDEIIEWRMKCLDSLYEFNMTRPTDHEKRKALLKKMFAEIGENCYIEPPFHSTFGGSHVHFGKKVHAGFNLTCMDDTHIYIGDDTILEPNVTITTVGHPLQPDLRKKTCQYNAPVRIGKNCWIGTGVIILPGITIGNNVVVGAGSVVTQDLPSNVIAIGNPCRISGKSSGEVLYEDSLPLIPGFL